MIGLDKFKTFFSGYEENYVVIGGTACTLLAESAGIDFRSTKDIDVVLIVENLTTEFARHFWDFIKQGEYSIIYNGIVNNNFYRFEKPEKPEYPKMIELFTRKPTETNLFPNAHLLPLHIADDVSSLSAILLDDDYYNFLKEGVKITNGISVLDEAHLIPFKAKAWCELSDRNLAGEIGLTKHIKKHKKDIITLLSLTNRSI